MMKVKAPLMRTRRVAPSTTLDDPLLPSMPLHSRTLDASEAPHPIPIHELETIDIGSLDGDQAPSDYHHDGDRFGNAPIQRVRNGDGDESESGDEKKDKRKTKRTGKQTTRKEITKKEDRRDKERDEDRKKKREIKKPKVSKRKKEDRSEDSDPPPEKLKRVGTKDNVKRKPVRKPKNDSEDEDSRDNWDPRDYHRTTGAPLKKRRQKKETLNDIFPTLKENRTMTVPKKHDFYHDFFSHEDTGSLFQSLSDQAMEEYEKMLTGVVTPKKLKEQGKYIKESLHTDEVEEPEKYYDTEFDQHALSLHELKKIVKTPKKKEELEEKESSTPWRQPVPGIRYQPKGSLVTSFDSDDDYNSITKKLKSGVSNKEITPMEIGIVLNQPTPKDMREKLEGIKTLKDKKRTSRKNYTDEEEMPSTMNYLYNLGYTERSVEQKRNRSLGPYLGLRNTLISNESFTLDDSFSKSGKGGMVTYPGSGTETKANKEKTNKLIGFSMSQIEHQNLRDTDLGEKSRRMSGTNRNLKRRGKSARNLAKAAGKKKGMKLREGTPPPPSLSEAKKDFKFQLMLDYASINDRDIVEENKKYVMKEGGHEDSFSEEDEDTKVPIKKNTTKDDDKTPKKVITSPKSKAPLKKVRSPKEKKKENNTTTTTTTKKKDTK